MDGWMDGMGWDISLTPPTTRAPLAVLITKLCSFIVQIYKLKRIHQDESCWKPLVVTIIQCFEYDHTGHIYIDVDLVYVSWDFMFEWLYSHTVYIYI